jgi:translation elongation factor P/translation initiation factor 5A
MNTKINNTRISKLMKHKNIKVVSIDTENMLYTCDDGNEYPLMDGLETLSIEELQRHIDSAKQTTLGIIEKIENEDG